ncbi:MAG: Gfo/Idh/MocA family oxidoreductase [Kiritimatiellae bacterium]|nr:Gfo/Idh/MocA family oxidoreductase [Kiritimatiellia bacterium]
MDAKLRIGIVECGHWHSSGYIRGLRAAGENIVAVSDRNPDAARKKAGDPGCRVYSDYRALLETEKPDFVFAFGRHFEMPAIANALVDARIPFCMEKPAGIHPEDVRALAARAEAKGVYAVVPFLYRSANWTAEIIRMRAAGELGELAHLYFRYIAGSSGRYLDWDCGWMLDKKQAGGGCAFNLGVHYLDLFNYITRQPVRKIAASMNNNISQADVEEASSIILTSETGVIGVVETGYGMPGNGVDSSVSIVTSRHFMELRAGKFIINGQNGQVREMMADTASYELFVNRIIAAFKRGQAPVAGLMDAYETLQLLDRAYRAAGNICHDPLEKNAGGQDNDIARKS